MVTQSGVSRQGKGEEARTPALWLTRGRADFIGANVLLAASIALTWPLWETSSGVVNYIDYNLPVSTEGIGAALRNSLSPWAGTNGLGRLNVGFLGTAEFLALFRLVSTPFGIESGSRLMLILLVWFDALGAYVVLRASYRLGIAGACSGALFYILNPWVYDAISQGHLYTLEVLAIAPFLILAVPRLRDITIRAVIGIAVSTAVAFGSDYHFGILILIFLGAEAMALVIRGKRVRAMRLTLGVGAGLGLLSFYLVPYISSIGVIQANNRPPISDLIYFSNFTSWHSAFSLLRPGMNAWAEVSAHGDFLRITWSTSLVAIAFVAGVMVVRGHWRWLTGSPVLPCFALASVLLANGANGVTRGAALWAYSNVPLAGIFRDPSKFLLFPLLLYVPTAALIFSGRVPHLLKRGRATPRSSPDAPNEIGPSSRRAVAASVPSRRGWLVAGPALVTILFVPLIAGGIRTISTVPSKSDNAARTPGARLAYLPPWQYVRYPQQPVPVNDPVQLYARSGVARLGPEYDSGNGNSFLRWLYSDLYFRRTDAFYNLVRLAGISDVIERLDVAPITGSRVTQQMFAKQNLVSALRTQDATYKTTRQDVREVTRRITGASTISSASALLKVHGTNLGVLNDVADLINVGAPAICFEPDCPSRSSGLTIGALDDVPPEPNVSNELKIQTTDSYNRSVSGDWIDGRVASGEGFGAITEQLVDVAVGIGNPHGLVSYLGNHEGETRQLWVQVLRGPNPIKYTIRCGRRRFSISPPPTLGSFHWTWNRLGLLEIQASESLCQIRMKGRLGAVAGGTLAPRSSRGVDIDDHYPRILVSPASAAYSWRRAKPSSFNYPGLTSTAAIVSDGGGLRFPLPPATSPRHVYARVVGIRGRVFVQAARVKRHPTRSAIKRDQRAWVDLGELNDSQRQVEIAVRGGKAAILRIAVAAPRDMAALHAIGASKVPIRLSGDIGLKRTGDVTIKRLQPNDKPTYLIVRSAAGGFWSLDGRDPDGTYAGYGQLYRMSDDTSTLSSVLRVRAAFGAALSALVMGGLLFTIAMPWIQRRLRRSPA